MPKLCRDYPNCTNDKCGFDHPIVLTKDEKMDENIKIEKPQEIKEDIPCVLFQRKNLGSQAQCVRGAAFSVVKGLTSEFPSNEVAILWIKENGDKEYLYQMRMLDPEKRWRHFVWDEYRKWHETSFRQDQNRGYRSDKNPKLRIH